MKTLKHPVRIAATFVSSVILAGCGSSDSPATMDDGADGELPTTTIINQEGYQALLHTLLPIVDGTRLDALSDEITAFVDSIGDSNTTLSITRVNSSFDAETQLETVNYTCDAGGAAVLKIVGRLTEYEFEQCVLNQSTYDGNLRTNYQQDQSDIVFSELNVVSPSGNDQLNGIAKNFNSASAFYRQSRSVSFDSVRISGENAAEITNFTLLIVATDNDGETSIERSFQSDVSVVALWLGDDDQSLQVRTTQVFTGKQPDDFYSNGSMSVIASDGSTLVLNADNGDPATVQITVNAAGATHADTLIWDDLLRIACLDNTSMSSGPQFACGN